MQVCVESLAEVLRAHEVPLLGRQASPILSSSSKHLAISLFLVQTISNTQTNMSFLGKGMSSATRPSQNARDAQISGGSAKDTQQKMMKLLHQKNQSILARESFSRKRSKNHRRDFPPYSNRYRLHFRSTMNKNTTTSVSSETKLPLNYQLVSSRPSGMSSSCKLATMHRSESLPLPLLH